MRRPTALNAALPLALAAALTACAPAPETWQVVAVYTDPDTPGDLPDRADFQLRSTSSGETLTGTTPCARIEGAATLESDTLTLGPLTITPTDFDGSGECNGAARYTHDKVAGLLVEGNEFGVKGTSPREKLLTLHNGEINPPSVRALKL